MTLAQLTERARTRYAAEAADNRRRFATEGARVMIGDPRDRVLLPIESRREIYVRPAISVVDDDSLDLFFMRCHRAAQVFHSWFWSHGGIRLVTRVAAGVAFMLLAITFTHSALISR